MSRLAQNRLIATIFVVLAVAGTPGLVSAQESSDLVKETRELLEVINQNRAEIAQIKEKLEGAQGEQRVLLQRRRASKGEDAFSRFGASVLISST